MRAAMLLALLVAASQPARADDCAFPQRAGSAGERIAGSGRIVEDSRSLPGFSAPKVADGVDVELRASGREKSVTVRAGDDAVPLLEARVEGTTLVIGTARGASFGTRHRPQVLVEFVRATDELDVAIAESGDVVYGGTPKVNKSIAGSGSVRPAR